MNFKSPDELFLAAKSQILHQDDTLFALAVPLYYHLRLLNLYLKHDHRVKNTPAPTSGQAVKPTTKDETPLKPPLNLLNLPAIPQQTVFITGKTGSGKTHLIKTLCQLSGLNFLSFNATHISNSGYKGLTLEDIGMMIKEKAQSERHAEFTVLFLDEFDKLFVKNSTNVGDWHRAVATELLTIMEGTSDFPVKDKSGIDSRHILFILGGSFEMHKETRPVMGFVGEHEREDVPTSQLAFGELGLPDELAGRIGRVIAMSPLDDVMLKDILKNSPTSPLTILSHQLSLEYCTVMLDETLMDELIMNAKDNIEKFGVRGVYQAFHLLPQVIQVLADAPTARYHHYVITKDGFNKTYRPEYRPMPKITINVQVPAPPTNPKKTIDLDDLPF